MVQQILLELLHLFFKLSGVLCCTFLQNHISLQLVVSLSSFFCFLCKRILEIFVYLSVGFCIQQFSIVHIFFLPNKEHIQHLFNILSYCSHFDISLANLALVFQLCVFLNALMQTEENCSFYLSEWRKFIQICGGEYNAQQTFCDYILLLFS